MTEFKPLENLESGVKFTDVYGDTFISGTCSFVFLSFHAIPENLV